MSVTYLHLLELPNAIDLFHFFGIKLFEQLIAIVISLGMDDNDVLRAIYGDPGKNARIASGAGLRVRALKDIAKESFPHLLLQDALLRPVKEFET